MADLTFSIQHVLSGTPYRQLVIDDGAALFLRLGDALASATAADSSGNGHTGTVFGGVTFGQATPMPDGDTAALLNGTTGYISVPHAAGITPTGDFSVECLLKASPSSLDVPLVQKFSGGAHAFDGFLLSLNGDAISPGKVNLWTGQSWVHGNTRVDDGQWHHVVAVLVGSNVKFYIDGALDATTTPTTPSLGDTHALEVGRRFDSPAYAAVTIDEVALYLSALTSTQIRRHYLAGQWVTVSTDLRAQQPIVCEYGIQGSTPNDRIASAGQLSYALNNSERNSATLLGYYSPLNASKRVGFDFNIPTRLVLSAAGVSGGADYFKFRGKLADITPVAGLEDSRLVPCQAFDLMDEYANLDLPDLDTQLSQRSDELVITILDALDADDQPADRDIETGLETYDVALDGGATGAQPKVRDVLNQICLSEFGYFYIKGDATQGGTARFENRHHRAANPTVLATLTDALIDGGGIAVPGSRDDIYSTVQVFVRPTRVDAAAATVLFSLQTTSTIVQPGETFDSIFGPYRDPTNNDQIGGTEQVAPAATTDYTMNTASDGSGIDLTASFTVTASFTGLGVRFTIVNNGTLAGYVTKLQLRGKGIYRYDALIEVAVAGGYGSRVLTMEMTFQNNVNVGNDVATYLAQILSTPFAHIKSVRFCANKSVTLMGYAIEREPGDRVAISETVTGVDAEFTINSVRLEIHPGGILWCTWGLEPAITQMYWLLGESGASELDETTVLGF